MNNQNSSSLFNAYYYTHYDTGILERNSHWLTFFDGIAGHIAKDIQPQTILDAGCAIGILVECLRKKGLQAFGLDISEYAIQNAYPEIKPYCWVGSVTAPFPQQYDLIVCMEVLEHLPHEEAEMAVENLCRYSNDILFSSTPFDYKETTHFNVQPPEYWAELFARQGYFRDIEFDASFITPWAVRYRRCSEPLSRIVLRYERKFFLLWKENFDLRNLAVANSKALAANEQMLAHLSARIADGNQVGQGQSAGTRQGIRTWYTKIIPTNSPIDRFLHFLRRIFQNGTPK